MAIIERDENGKLINTTRRDTDLKNRENNMKLNRKQKDEHRCSKVYATWKPSKGCT
jgi:hypothetical protein